MHDTIRSEQILSQLTGDFRLVAILIGVDNALKLSGVFGGITITVPKLNSIHLAERDREIRKEYDSGVPDNGSAHL